MTRLTDSPDLVPLCKSFEKTGYEDTLTWPECFEIALPPKQEISPAPQTLQLHRTMLVRYFMQAARH